MSERKPTQKQKQEAQERAGGFCEYCYSPADHSPTPFSVEHILPRHHGGTNHMDNLAFSCQGCNNHKFTSTEAVDPNSGQTVPLYHPRRDIWNEHFGWDDRFLLIIGRTPTGRATIIKLHLNRLSVVNIRRVLRLDGQFPPETAREE